jgi:hypothetical protein
MLHSPSARLRTRSAVLVLALLAALVTSAAVHPVEAATPKRPGILLGIAGDVGMARSRTGQAYATHPYSRFTERVPDAKMLTVKSSASWRSTANVAPGSAAYKDIVRWATTLKARGKKVYLSFHHEPEAVESDGFGTPDAYKAAYRRVVTIFRAHGAKNVIFTWQLTDWAFRADRSDPRYAGKWYPGDAYVDVVGADVYNWYTCGHGRGQWMSLKSLAGPMLGFAKEHGKQAVLPEFASHRNARRATWLARGLAYLARHDRLVAAAFYWNQGPTNPGGRDCAWKLGTDAEYNALRRAAARPLFKQ